MRAAVVLVFVGLGCASPPAVTGPDAAGAGTADGSPASFDAQGPLASDAGTAPDATAAPADAAGAGPDAAPAVPPDAGGVSHCGETPTGRVTLPADDTVHSESMEWWYWTGHLKTADGRWFGFEQVFFGTLVLGQRGRMAHVAVTDIDGGKFHYDTQIHLGAYTPVANGFDFSMPPQTAKGGDGHDVLHGEADGWVLDLTLDAAKPPVYQHDVGYTDYPFGGFTYYYSRERMNAVGTLKNGSTTYAVTGNAWFDHQWGSIAQALKMGWDWFALELEGGRELMLFIVRDSSQQILVGGSYTDEFCVTKSISGTSVQVLPLGDWTSPRTGCTYPSGWTVVVEGKTYTVTPALKDQEVSTAVPIYWEGACTVSGDATGRAYVELTGYCP